MGQVMPVSVYLGNRGKLGRLGPYSPIIGTNTHKVIYSVKLHISHQMKPYFSAKAI